ATHRRTQGLPAQSMAWGLWNLTSGMATHLTDGDIARLGRSGLVPLTSSDGLELLDAALDFEHPLAVPVRFDTAGLSEMARTGTLPAILRELSSTRLDRRHEAGAGMSNSAWTTKIAGHGAEQQQLMITEFVGAEVAAVLGFDPSEIDMSQAFQELGFDSLSAVELRNRLRSATGLPLPITMAFDYPSPDALAAFIHGEIAPSAEAVVESADSILRQKIAEIPIDRLRHAGLLDLIIDLADAGRDIPESREAEIATMELDQLITAALDDF
ncbi:beta-ketoacyl reductase, partial [Nocardia sp. NPDC005978]|uniref:beta-ketoacyl reductase n=1 Tax=Nocardia sp. NPDC005978 TaxID=3156725 RepID=UPI0033A36756